MKRLKLFSLIFILEILFSGCIKEYYTLNKAILINNTSHQLTIIPFKVIGIEPPSDTLYLLPNDSITILNGTSRGEKSGVDWEGIFGSFKQVGDSVIVVFDNSFSVTHYYQIPPDSLFRSKKYYLYISDRNILNFDNFKLNQKKIKRHLYENILWFQFTEADYDYAKE